MKTSKIFSMIIFSAICKDFRSLGLQYKIILTIRVSFVNDTPQVVTKKSCQLFLWVYLTKRYNVEKEKSKLDQVNGQK